MLLVLAFASSVAFALAAVMTFLDWRLNPGGIFHDDADTNWTIVLETAMSWFVPVLLLALVLALPVAIWRFRRHRPAKRD